MKKFLVKIIGFSLLFILLFEVFAQVLPAAEYPVNRYDAELGFELLDKNYAPKGRFAYGRLSEIQADWQINNEGWNSKIDYLLPHQRSNKPLLAISGDSYVNSLYCNDAQQISGYLRTLLQDSIEVYSFGNAGTNMCDYWKYARYYHKFKPDYCVYMVNYGDITSSLKSYKPNTTASQVVLSGDTLAVLHKNIETSRSFKDLMRNSKAWTYLNQNFNFFVKVLSLVGTVKQKMTGAGTVKPTPKKELGDEHKLELGLLIRSIIRENPEAKHVFVIHPNRTAVYASDNAQKEDLAFFIKTIETDTNLSSQIQWVDLTAHFAKDYSQNHQPFEFKINHHFSPYGNETAAKGILNHCRFTKSLLETKPL